MPPGFIDSAKVLNCAIYAIIKLLVFKLLNFLFIEKDQTAK